MKTKINFMNLFWAMALLSCNWVGTGRADDTANTSSDLSSLESQLAELQMPTNVAPAAVSQEKLYSVQTRYNPLKKRFGMSMGTAQNLSGSNYLRMTQAQLQLRYHFSDRWSMALGGAYGFNSFSSDGERLLRENIFMDAAIVKTRAHALVAYNLFYGKFRVSMDRVLYFDQYIAIGPGLINTQYGSSPSAVADIGFVFWAGKNWDIRFGFQNEFFNEKRLTSSSFERHTLGHLDVGYTFSTERL